MFALYLIFMRNLKEIKKKNIAKLFRKLGTIKGTNNFKKFFRETSKPWYGSRSLPRELIFTINRIRANHSKLVESLARVKIINSALFECVEGDETIDHVLWQCSKYSSQRKKLIKILKNTSIQFP